VVADISDVSRYVHHHDSKIGVTGVGRHPDDPEPVRASKARAVWWLGLLALLTGPLVGGVVPGTVALLLAAQFRQDATPAAGFLTGTGQVRRGELLAWTGILLAGAAIVAAILVAAYRLASTPAGPEFPPSVD
jgi:hypothetical protein